MRSGWYLKDPGDWREWTVENQTFSPKMCSWVENEHPACPWMHQQRMFFKTLHHDYHMTACRLHNAPLTVPTTWVLTAILLNGGRGGGNKTTNLQREQSEKERERERRQTHDVSPLRWHTERRRISRVEVPGEEKQNCRAEIIGNCEREKKRKHVSGRGREKKEKKYG